VNGNGSVDLTPAPEEAPERELDFGSVVIGLGHARKYLGGVVEAIVDEMVEAHVIVTGETHRAGGTHASAQKPGGRTDGHKGQCEQKWRQLEHLVDC
jgi:hypothetical protein